MYAGFEHVNALLTEGAGVAMCWDGSPIRWRPFDPDDVEWRRERNTDVRVLRVAVPEDDEFLRGLVRWRDWLQDYGASLLASIGSTSHGLLRATIDRPIWLNTAYPDSVVPPLHTLIGGRQLGGLKPLRVRKPTGGEIRNYDLPAAYATLLGTLPYGRGWLELPASDCGDDFLDKWNGVTPAFATARVSIPPMGLGPLPERPSAKYNQKFWFDLTEYPVDSTIRGLWTIAELKEAVAVGCDVQLRNVWLQVANSTPPFAPWFDAVKEGRRMRGFAGTLAKMTGNSLWGQFAISPKSQKTIRWKDNGKFEHKRIPYTTAPRALDIAEHLTGTVRAQLFRFAIQAGEKLITAHTDGAWVKWEPGDEYEGWRVKMRTPEFRYLSPQMYSYHYRKGNVYKTAAFPRASAKEVFEERWRRAGGGERGRSDRFAG